MRSESLILAEYSTGSGTGYFILAGMRGGKLQHVGPTSTTSSATSWAFTPFSGFGAVTTVLLPPQNWTCIYPLISHSTLRATACGGSSLISVALRRILSSIKSHVSRNRINFSQLRWCNPWYPSKLRDNAAFCSFCEASPVKSNSHPLQYLTKREQKYSKLAK